MGIISGFLFQIDSNLLFLAKARYTTKMMMRSPILDKLRKERAEDTKAFLELVCKESTQKIITGYLKKLADKSKK